MKFILLIVMMSIVIGSTDFVKIEVKPRTLEVIESRPASFDVYLRSGEGIHVNAQPAITIKSGTEGVDFSIASLVKAGDYLDLSKPIKIACKVDGLGPGAHRADFVLSYTYCSDKEGWCRMGKDKSSVEIKVKN